MTFLHHSSVKSCNVNRCQVGIFLSFLRYRYSALIFVIDILRKHYGYTRNTSSHAIFFILPILDWLLEGTESGRSNDLHCESKWKWFPAAPNSTLCTNFIGLQESSEYRLARKLLLNILDAGISQAFIFCWLQSLQFLAENRADDVSIVTTACNTRHVALAAQSGIKIVCNWRCKWKLIWTQRKARNMFFSLGPMAVNVLLFSLSSPRHSWQESHLPCPHQETESFSYIKSLCLTSDNTQILGLSKIHLKD